MNTSTHMQTQFGTRLTGLFRYLDPIPPLTITTRPRREARKCRVCTVCVGNNSRRNIFSSNERFRGIFGEFSVPLEVHLLYVTLTLFLLFTLRYLRSRHQIRMDKLYAEKLHLHKVQSFGRKWVTLLQFRYQEASAHIVASHKHARIISHGISQLLACFLAHSRGVSSLRIHSRNKTPLISDLSVSGETSTFSLAVPH